MIRGSWLRQSPSSKPMVRLLAEGYCYPLDGDGTPSHRRWLIGKLGGRMRRAITRMEQKRDSRLPQRRRMREIRVMYGRRRGRR